MGPWQSREYFKSKYCEKYGQEYSDDRLFIELALFKRLLKRHSFYIIIEAIELFLKKTSIDKSTIAYFTSYKSFESMFRDLIKIEAVIKYKRFLPFYGDDKEMAGTLLQEYSSYATAWSLGQEEINRKAEILVLLEEIHAKSVGGEGALINQGS